MRLMKLLTCMPLLFGIPLKSTQNEQFISIEPDVARIVIYSYEEVAQPDERKNDLDQLYTLIKQSETTASVDLITKSLKNVITILESNKNRLPTESNWEIIIASIESYLREINAPLTLRSKGRTIIGCNCSNCRFSIDVACS